MKRIYWLLLSGLMLGGCMGGRGDFRDQYRAGWNEDTVTMARQSWLYAQLSNNAYEQKELPPERRSKPEPFLYRLPESVREIGHGSQAYYDLQYVVYERERTGQTPEVMIAFRGTQFTHWSDWWQGNLLGSQNFIGAGVFDVLRERYPNRDISVTGHSLGGGIATHISLNRPAVRSYVFNSSPRFWRDTPRDDNETVDEEAGRRRSVVEFGEILKLGRAPGSEATQIYSSVGCTIGQNAIEQHSISRLATCLTFIAAYEDPVARESICLNHLEDYWPANWRRPEGLTCRPDDGEPAGQGSGAS